VLNPYREQGVVFSSGQNRLVGIATIPEVTAEVGVLILVGGPQYRAGSHRQFTLLARSLGEAGIASFRFDFAGMGDSEGQQREFDKTLEDTLAAIEAFMESAPGVSRLVLWGLCDAASSAMMFAHRHPKVTGMILLNPWVHSGEYAPQVKIAYFYRPFLSRMSKWRQLVSGKNKIIPVLKEIGRDTLALVESRSFHYSPSSSRQSFVQGMVEGLQRFQHSVLIVLSENDLTASEFSSLIAHDPKWREATSSREISLNTVLGADHTFSKTLWKEEVSQLTIQWLKDR
jgi:exosortase A-associated hydrolase 1